MAPSDPTRRVLLAIDKIVRAARELTEAERELLAREQPKAAKEKSEVRTYIIPAYCTNCGAHSKVAIPHGTTVADAMAQDRTLLLCSHCGCHTRQHATLVQAIERMRGGSTPC